MLLTTASHAQAIVGDNGAMINPDPDIREVHRSFTIQLNNNEQAQFYLGEDTRYGSLHLMNPVTHERVVRINPSWWLDELIQVQVANIDADEAQEIIIKATYYTGIGPTGAQSFLYTFYLDHHNGQWTSLYNKPPSSPKPRKINTPRQPKAPFNTVHGKLLTAETQQALAQLNLNLEQVPELKTVDFDRYKVIFKHYWLTSGSKRIQHTAIHKHNEQHLFYYTVHSPSIGTTDMKSGYVYAIIPKQITDVTFAKAQTTARKGQRLNLTTGSL